MQTSNFRINSKRFESNFKALAEIGSTEDGGVHRPALSHAHLEARQWFRARVEEAGLDFSVDGAGNHTAHLQCGPSNAAALLLGSHLDSVPNGGRFDGALGLLAAFEVLQVVHENRINLPYHLEAVDFTDEEGTLVGLMGSLAMTGKLSPQDLREPRGGKEVLQAGLSRAGLSEKGILNAQRDASTLAGYLELHIEQGRRLMIMGADLGVVTSIAGIGSYRLTFIGRADHAGTTSIADRLDAAQGASAFTLTIREILLDQYPQCVANVGAMKLDPGAFNIVPERASLSLEYRAPDMERFQSLETTLLDMAQELAERYHLGLEVEFLGKTHPAPMDPIAQKSIMQAAKILNLEAVSLASGAGHDAQSFSDFCPTGMIFVPSEDGASHSPREFTKWEDCIHGANALLQATLLMASQIPG